MKERKRLKDVTVVCIDTVNIGKAIIALRKTLSEVEPDACRFLTSAQVDIEGVETIIIPEIRSVDEYSKFCIQDLYLYVDTKFMLIIQHDGYVLHGDKFNDELYEYDYCGALWLERDGLNQGNGGFSWRSKSLMQYIAFHPSIEVLSPEDVSICRIYRRMLEQAGFKWATDKIAEEFSFELREPNQITFGFHSYFHPEFKKTVVIQRMGAMGDVIALEPVLRRFYEDGYRVVLKTTMQFYALFAQHDFPIIAFEDFDGSRIPYKFINLDMSYESKPKQNHLKTYYEFCGIDNGEMVSPKLNLYQNTRDDIKLFEKYCIIHIDEREQPYRNIYGINWEHLCKVLISDGYTVIQVGTTKTRINNAIKINTPSIQFLMWVVASSDLFIGIDSGISHIAAGFSIPSIILFGSVSPYIIHAVDDNKIYIYNEKVCHKPFCWHDEVGTTGVDCYIDKKQPPCTQFNMLDIYNSLQKITSNEN